MGKNTKKVRRYCRATVKEIAEGTGLSEGEVKKVIQELLKDGFVRLGYSDSGRLIPDFYEIPESLGEIEGWRGVPGERQPSRRWLLFKAVLWILGGLTVFIGMCHFLVR